MALCDYFERQLSEKGDKNAPLETKKSTPKDNTEEVPKAKVVDNRVFILPKLSKGIRQKIMTEYL